MRGGAPGVGRILPIMGGAFSATLGVSAFVFAFPLITSQDALSGTGLGLAFSGFFLARTLVAPAAGAYSDRRGPRRALLPAAAAGALLPFVYLLFPRLEMLYAVQFCLGLCGGVVKPVSAAAVAALAGDKARGSWLGRYNSLVNAAFFLGPVLGGLLYFHRQAAPVVLFLSGAMTLAFCCFFAVPKRTAVRRRKQGGGAVSREDRRLLARLFPAVAGRTLQIGCFMAFYPVLLSQRLGEPAVVSGLLFAVPSLAGCLGMTVSGRLADTKDKTLLTLSGMALSAFCTALLPFCGSVAQFALTGAGIGVGTLFSLPAAMSLAAGLGQGRGLGLMNAAAGIGFVCGPLLGGACVRYFGGLNAAFVVTALAGAVLFLPLLALALERRLHYSPRAAAVLAVAAGLLLCVGTTPFFLKLPAVSGPGLHHYTTVDMGTVIRLTLVGDGTTQADALAQDAFEHIAKLRGEVDHRNEFGAVGRINQAAGKRPVKVGPDVFGLIKRALAHAEATKGALDPTIGAATVAPMYFARKKDVLREKKHLVDYSLVRLDEAGHTVFLPRPGMALDLGAVAKGWIVDETVEYLRKQGVRAGLLDAGGDVYCFGDRDWRVGLRDPRGERVLDAFALREQSMCGSGDYHRYVLEGEHARRHHILDPSSMDSAGASTATAVLADKAETADALSTALFVLGPEKGMRLLAEHYPDIAALWILPDGVRRATKNFPGVAAH